jgi:hypothetical protein
MKSNSQRGVALVITLIMLSVITVMAVAFLSLTRRERVGATGSLDLRDAMNANNAGLESAKAHMVADILTRVAANSNDWQGLDFTVSTNFVNRAGFDPTRSANWDNVNYDSYINNRTNPPPLSNDADFQQIVDNLIYEPRPPVFVDRFRSVAGPDFRTNEFRYYLDLNRNGQFDDTDFVALVDNNNQPIVDAAGKQIYGYFAGDPQWIGILERPDLPHSAANKFIGRYCYVILPVGKTLDINFIHNQGKERWGVPFDANGYMRSQGHGTWELNLASFLADLNTNIWNPNNGRYVYNTNLNGGSLGVAFQDARDVLRYRYLPIGVPISSPDPRLFLPPATSALPALINNNTFATDFIDAFADGLADPSGIDDDIITQPWPGSENPKHFFSIHDFLDPSKSNVFPNFAGRLARASTGNATSDRYTLYNLLAQMGTDSSPENGDKININYDDRMQFNPFGSASATNLYSWSSTNFFRVVADRLLRDQMRWERANGFTNLPDDIACTNIAIYPTNYYTPALHRLLQMAVNIYDATSNRVVNPPPTPYVYPPFYPTVLRPVFKTTSANNRTNIVIVGYEEAGSGPALVADLTNTSRWKDLNDLRGEVQPNDFVYGIPFLIGAKKGYPNFNELMVETTAQIERKAEVVKENVALPFPRYTNQMYVLGVSNIVGLEAWNSYGQNMYPDGYFPRDLVMFAACELNTVVTNEDGVVWFHEATTNNAVRFLANTNERWTNGTYRFPVPLGAGTNWVNSMALTNSIYRAGPRRFEATYDKPIFEDSRAVGFRGHQWVALVTNRVRYFLFDNGRLVDAVSFAGLGTTMKIAEKLHSTENLAQWNTNRVNNSTSLGVPTWGLVNQCLVSLPGGIGAGVTLTDWRDYATINDVNRAKAGFQGFLDPTNKTKKAMQVPYTPVMRVVHRSTWQVNDPLVHYMAQDLFPKEELAAKKLNEGRNPDNLGNLNDAFKPWGGNPRKLISDAQDEAAAFNYRVKDPLISSSDNWNFPTNKLASIGDLGRVHRGTPWQTIYLKSDMADIQEWTNQHPTMLSHPTNDWRLMDIFTVASHPNATRGQLPINQTNVPAWSALLSGVTATTIRDNSGSPTVEDYIIQPAALEPYVSDMVAAINTYRRQLPGKQFARLSEVLAVTNLTAGSPFLHPPFITDAAAQMKSKLLRDSDYERIPEQIMSLIKLGDTRYVIYTWGQSLKPAHVVTSGSHRGLVDNYQITAEVATRAVVRIDFEAYTNRNDIHYEKPNYQRPRAVTESFNIMSPE